MYALLQELEGIAKKLHPRQRIRLYEAAQQVICDAISVHPNLRFDTRAVITDHPKEEDEQNINRAKKVMTNLFESTLKTYGFLDSEGNLNENYDVHRKLEKMIDSERSQYLKL